MQRRVVQDRQTRQGKVGTQEKTRHSRATQAGTKGEASRTGKAVPGTDRHSNAGRGRAGKGKARQGHAGKGRQADQGRESGRARQEASARQGGR